MRQMDKCCSPACLKADCSFYLQRLRCASADAAIDLVLSLLRPSLSALLALEATLLDVTLQDLEHAIIYLLSVFEVNNCSRSLAATPLMKILFDSTDSATAMSSFADM